MTTATISAASAGGIANFFKGVGGTIANSWKTIGNAIVGTAEYAFTSKSGEECYADMKKAAGKTWDNIKDTGSAVMETQSDMLTFAMGQAEMVVGAVGTGAAAAYEGVSHLVTGKGDYSATKKMLGVMKDGYERYDKGFDTVGEAASLTGPVGNVVVSGIKVVKTGGEVLVGYHDKTLTDLKDVAVDSAINVAVGAVSAGASQAAGNLVKASAKTMVQAATGTVVATTAQTISDVNNKNETRGVGEIIFDNFCTNAAKAAAVTAGKQACSKPNAAPQNQQNNADRSFDFSNDRSFDFSDDRSFDFSDDRSFDFSNDNSFEAGNNNSFVVGSENNSFEF